MFSYYLLRHDVVKEPRLKKRNFKKFKILELKTRNTMLRNSQDKKIKNNLENQDKTKNAL